MRSATRKKKKEKSFIPVIFTIGVIGWGFFAIDRLTRPAEAKSSYTDNSPRREYNVSSWRKKLSNWLDKITEPENSLKEFQLSNIPSTSAKIPVIDDRGVSPYVQVDKSASVQIQLYYLPEEGDPVLRGVQRDIESGNDHLKSFFQALIVGPNYRETENGYLDAFPAKPDLLGVAQQGSIMVFDFGKQYGLGESQDTLRYQLGQLLDNARQFPGVEGISILINGERVPYLGGDGIALPDVIDEEFLSRL